MCRGTFDGIYEPAVSTGIFGYRSNYFQALIKLHSREPSHLHKIYFILKTIKKEKKNQQTYQKLRRKKNSLRRFTEGFPLPPPPSLWPQWRAFVWCMLHPRAQVPRARASNIHPQPLRVTRLRAGFWDVCEPAGASALLSRAARAARGQETAGHHHVCRHSVETAGSSC